MDRIINYREKIDEIDDKIMSLLEERYNLAEQI
ncbi:MAG: chorismate mutase, partial [Firmicutes bacterium]|nr:chorismate mutase [Bacillota bacterium]